MDAKTIEFLALLVFSAVAIAAGYLTRRLGWLREQTSRHIHWFTVVVLWSSAGLLSLWNLAPAPGNFWVLILEPVLVGAAAFLTIPIAKALRLERKQVGVLAIAAGISNTGFALGSYLGYALLPTPTLLDAMGAVTAEQVEQRSIEALAYGVLVVTVMSTATVVLLFPVAHHFGAHEQSDTPLGRLIFKSFVDWKAMLFYSAIVGVALAYSPLKCPPQVHDWYLLKVLFYLGACGAYFGVGMRLHLDHLRPHFRSHLLLGIVKFALTPAVTVGLLALVGLLGFTGVTPPPPLMSEVLILLAFMPCAIQTVILSNLFHLDARMACSVWLVNSLVFCVVVLPVILLLVPRL